MKRTRSSPRTPVLTGIALAVQLAFAHPANAAPPLAPGTLPSLLTGGRYQGLSGAPTTTGTRMDITQAAAPQGQTARAYIDWASFNIAADSMVNFNQPTPTSMVLNNIFQGVPSVIQGQLKANGIVYLINQNGILFDKGSQVNVGGLVASALGLNSVNGQTFFDSASAFPTNQPVFSGYGTDPQDGKPAQIQLLGTINASHNSSVMVFAPRIRNEGTISAPDGQVILAAGQKVWLSTDSNDTSMRGFIVEYQADPTAIPKADPNNPTAPLYSDASGVVNLGQVFADRGNATLAGLAINQSGVVSASSATVLNGSVWLIAREGGSASSSIVSSPRRGTVTLDSGSLTQTPVDATDTTTLARSTDAVPSNIRIEGQTIEVKGKTVLADGTVLPPAQVLAPAGNITLDAADPTDQASTTSSHIFVDTGAVISASGDWVDKAAGADLLKIQITSNELADAPLQRGGVLQGRTVIVDPNKGTPLFDITPFVNNVQQTAAEKAEKGGAISFTSQGDVVLRPGSVVDVSGGGTRYSAGQVYTTKLDANGTVVDISQASPNLHYSAILDSFQVTDTRWNQTQTFSLASMGASQFAAAGVIGQPAGTVSIAAHGAAIEGNILGSVVAGRSQLASGNLPAAGSLIIGNAAALSLGNPDFGFNSVVIGPSITLGDAFKLGDPLPAQLADGTVYLPSDLFRTYEYGTTQVTQQGFGSVALYANDTITLPAGQSVVMPAGGSLSLTSRSVDVEGAVNAPAGTVSVSAILTSAGGAAPTVTVGSAATLSTHGQWVNLTATGLSAAAQAGVPVQAVGSINAGNISITSPNIALSAGSTLDASGGGKLAANGSLAKGNGGTISVSGIGSVDLSGTLQAYALGTGGTLKITAPSLRIADQPSGVSGELLFTPERFAQGGFSQFSLASSSTGIDIAAGSTVNPVSRTLVLDAAGASQQPSGANLLSFAHPTLLDPSLRKPTGLSLTSVAGITVETGASIALDPQASLALTAKSIEIAGSLSAPAGNISLLINGTDFLSPGTVQVDSGAVIAAPGIFLQTPTTVPGQIKGSVLRAGSITMGSAQPTPGSFAANAAVIVKPGALIDVSGAAADVDIPTSSGPVRTHVTGDAGTITIAATHPSRIEGTLRGSAQGQSAGAAFELDFGKVGTDTVNDIAPRRIIVGQDVPAQGSTTRQGSLSSGVAPIDAYLGVGNLSAEGFDKLQLQAGNQIQFAGDLAVALGRGIRLDAPEFVATSGTQSVSFSAPQLAFGATKQPGTTSAPSAPAPGSLDTPGSTVLSLSTGASPTGMVELFGSTQLPGFGSVNISSAGDLRMSGFPFNTKDPTGALDAILGSFWTSGNVTLQAAQVYPTTFTSFTIGVDSPSGSVTVAPSAGALGPVYSAGGSLDFEAATIEQGGVLKAPLGQIKLNATKSVTLSPGSVTSVSADGLTIPYGGTLGGVTWSFDQIAVTAPPAKGITLSAPSVTISPADSTRAGAVVDLHGGGDIQGIEWIVGPGGSTDFLTQSGVYAVIPGVSFTPSDANIASKQPLGFGNTSNIYDSVYLSGGAGLPAGNYALLPGYYALLPGAYIVRAQPGFTDLQPGQIAGLSNGLAVVSGYRAVAGTGIRESRSSGFIIQPGSAAQQQAEYTVSNSSFFSSQAQANGQPLPALPQDAGNLLLKATSALHLGGTLNFEAAPGGASGQLQIAATSIAIVDSATQDVPGFLVLAARDLTATGARTLIGASADSTGTNLTVVSNNIEVANDSDHALELPELILASTGGIDVATGSVLHGTGTYAGRTSDLTTDGPGALLRVASGAPLSLTRTFTSTEKPPFASGTLTIAEGAKVTGDKAVLLDATASNILSGSVSVGAGGTVDVGAPRISVGETTGVTNGLVLPGDQLTALGSAGNLVLRSYSGIDLYGTASIGGDSLSSLTLRSGGLAGYTVGNANSATISADTVRIDNAIGGVFSGSPTGTGNLVVNARQITVGVGDDKIQGFGSVAMNASESFVGDGTGNLGVSGNLGITASRITGTTGSNQSISGLAVSLAQPATPTLPSEALAPGAQLNFTGATLTDNARIDVPSGKLTLTATGGNLTLGAGSLVNASSYTKSFGGITASAPAGSVALSSLTGNVVVNAGAVVDVSAHAGGDAGTISASAIAGTLQLQGTLLGNAAAGNTGGTFQADAGSLSNFSALIANTAAGGFTGAQTYRSRTGDITVGAADTVKSNQVTLVADGGNITMNGTIDASGAAGGGRVELDAANVLSLAAGSRILANGTSAGTSAADPYSNGGLVRLSTTSTAPGVTLSFDPSASIDVSSGGKGDAGRVEFYTTRTPAANASLNGAVVGNAGVGGSPGSVIVYGKQAYSVPTGNIDVSTGQADAQVFMGGPATAFQGMIAPSSGSGTMQLQGIASSSVSVRPDVELDSSGSLTLASNWDLTSAGWNTGNQPGLLTIRSGGTLDIRSTLGLPNPAAPSGANALFNPETIPTKQTWSIQLVGGADLNSANRLALKPLDQLKSADTGDVTLTVVPDTTNASGQPAYTARAGQLVRVRTGTGDIEVAAGRDFAFATVLPPSDTGKNPDLLQASRDLIASSRAAIYTTGTPTVADSVSGGSRFLAHGGDVRIYAQQNAKGVNYDSVLTQGWVQSSDTVFNQINQPFIGDWLRRTSTTADAGGWWADRRLFSGEIGSFGGGDISIVAGGDVNRLSAMNASSAQVGGVVNSRTLAVQGGGTLNVRAGGDLYGGDYLVSNNTGSISAGGMIGKEDRTGLYLIGASTDPARNNASVSVDATGDIRIQNLSNPTILNSSGGSGLSTLGISSSDGFANLRDTFFSYSPTDQVSLLSVAGNIDLDGTPRFTRSAGNWGAVLNIAPPKLLATAMTGDVFDGRIDSGHLPTPNNAIQRLFPSLSQSLQVLSGGDIHNIDFEAEDALPSKLPVWNSPLRKTLEAGPSDPVPSSADFHLSGTVARLVTPSADPGYDYSLVAQGSIYDMQLFAPREASVQAGLDIDTVQLNLQNVSASDVTIVKAGRDISFNPAFRSGVGYSSAPQGAIAIDGPGRLLVQAGRNINLGSTFGIQARGNADNASLPPQPNDSAALTIVAGYTGPISFSGVDTLFAGLTAAGNAHDAAAGDAAVNAMFLPQYISPVGNITMYQSTIITNGGSGIDLLVPSGAPNSALGGNINAGLPVKSDKEIGILTIGEFGGAIRAYTQNDFTVNQSKVITQLGGDITAYTSYGSIDAGRGSKAALTVTGAVKLVEIAPNTFIPQLPGVGSGIQTATYDPDGSGPQAAPKAGDVNLYAPRGTINAGEAGITSGGNVNLFALQILNAQNITAAGTASGIPVTATGSVAGALSAASNAGASAAQSATDSMRGNQNPGFGVSTIQVEVICVGGEQPCTSSN